MDFWSVIWVVIWSFLFVAYLFVFFYILMDLFRDHDLSGWWKALWIVFLIFAPFLTALVYLIARGRGMSDRQTAQARAARSETDAYLQQLTTTSGSASPAEHIADAKTPLDAGTITPAEFDQLKAKALA